MDKYLDVLKAAGINSMNGSLDTLNRKTFRKLTKRGQFDLVWTNIMLLLNHDFRVKITEKLPIHVRFIEFMPFQGSFWSSNQVVAINQMLDLAQGEFDIVSKTKNTNTILRCLKLYHLKQIGFYS